MQRIARGHELNTPAGADAQQDTLIQPTASDGRVIGLAVGENYARVDLSALLISVSSSNNKPLTAVPATMLLPENFPQGVPYFPLDVPFEVADRITVTVDSNTANSAAATPLMLVTFHELGKK